MNELQDSPKVLILYYSFSGQVLGLLHRLVAGLTQQGVQVAMEKLQPEKPLRFPVGSVPATLKMMVTTFFRSRIPIKELSLTCFEDYDLIILAGPTWSYNPSGPVLSFIDRHGSRLLFGTHVIPMISCRGYWRLHWYGLRGMLQKCGAIVPNMMVFDHPSKEPWRTVGVFLKIAGKSPERSAFIGKHYQRYGHSKDQQEEAFDFGMKIGEALKTGESLTGLCLRSLH